MSSNNKTPKLGLNLWDGADKPKRADFNNDNEVIDTILGDHIVDPDCHISSAEREKLNAPYRLGHYVGDGANSRTLNIGFIPTVIIIFSNLAPLATYDKETDHVYAYAGIGTTIYASAGIYIEQDRVVVTDSLGVPTLNNFYPRLNAPNHRYQYIAFK